MTECDCLVKHTGPALPTFDAADYAPMSGNFWDPNHQGLCVWAAYQPKLAVDQATSYIDLSGNGHDCIEGGTGPTWNINTGWYVTGAGYLVIPNFVIQSDKSQSMLIQYSGANIAANYKGLLGRSEAGFGRFAIYCRYNGDVVGYAHANGFVRFKAPALAAGNLAIAGDYAYRDGYFDYDLSTDVIGDYTQDLYIGRVNAHGASAYVQAVALYSCALTWIQVRQIARAMAAIAAI